MLRKLVIVVLLGAGLLGLAAGTTVVALESNEVAVLRTFGNGEDVLEVRVWVADDRGGTWIEAANPRKEFFRRMLRNPVVELVRRDVKRSYRAVPDSSREAHDRVRTLLARKYGWADRWIGVLVDTSESVAVHLVPVEEATRGVR